MKTFDEAQLRAFLALILDPSAGVVELRAFRAFLRRNQIVPSDGFHRTVAGWFDKVSHLVAAAGHLEGISGYVTLNPVRADLLARADNRVRILQRNEGTKDEDITIVRWLYVDLDARRPDGISSTAEELATARWTLERILTEHPALAACAIWGCSGNGYWILVRLPDLPNTLETYELIRTALAHLGDLYGLKARGDDTDIDPKTCNASRVMCLPGTLKCKGENRPDRPWRLVTLDSQANRPADWRPEPFDLAGWLASEGVAMGSPLARQNRTPDVPPNDTPAVLTPTADRAHRLHRAAAYLSAMPSAISGQGGHDQTYAAAAALIHGFELTEAEAWPIFQEFNQRCSPPWSDAELAHKLADAANKLHSRPRGYLHDAQQANSNGPGNGEGRALVEAMLVQAATANGQATGGHAGQDDEPMCLPGQERNPHRLARLALSQHYAHPDGPTLRFWRDEFHVWDGRSYQPMPTKEVRAVTTAVIETEFERLFIKEMIRHRMKQAARQQQHAGVGQGQGQGQTRGGAADKDPKKLEVTSNLTTDVIQALMSLTLLPVALYPAQPAWLDKEPGWATNEIMPARNALIHLPSLANGGICCRPTTPCFFTSWACDYDFSESAPEPVEWLRFLGSLWPDDEQSVQALQEWFGYCLTPNTRQQKILFLVGPRRSGKGTIARILQILIGPNNMAGPTLSGLATNFGLAPLIGKPLAIVDDARLSGHADQAVIVERLLTISGEGTLTIDRKNMDAWTGKLPTRLVILSNELPKLQDASGALASRLILLSLTASFYGREDKELFDRLMTDLPGILMWAVHGWHRLQEQGEFRQPASAATLLEAMSELSSPVLAFIRECCILDRDSEVACGDLFNAWKTWNQAMGTERVGDERSFGRKLHAAVPGLRRGRLSEWPRPRTYIGLRIKTPEETGRAKEPGDIPF